MSEDDLAEIRARLSAATEVAAMPWATWLETDGGLGGESFIQFREVGPDHADEMYLQISLGGSLIRGPSTKADAIIDLVGHAPADIAALLDEVERLRVRT